MPKIPRLHFLLHIFLRKNMLSKYNVITRYKYANSCLYTKSNDIYISPECIWNAFIIEIER